MKTGDRYTPLERPNRFNRDGYPKDLPPFPAYSFLAEAAREARLSRLTVRIGDGETVDAFVERVRRLP
jgi:hypothetical protein